LKDEFSPGVMQRIQNIVSIGEGILLPLCNNFCCSPRHLEATFSNCLPM